MRSAVETDRQRWEREILKPSLVKGPERAPLFTTISGRPIERLYTPGDVAAVDLPKPGEYPFTRGTHSAGYRGQPWTMRQAAGFGTPEDTNARYKALLAAGVTGLSVTFDRPTRTGRDADHPRSLGEVGTGGVSVSSLADMEALFDGIDLREITAALTVNSPAAMILAMYLVVAERQGVSWQTLSGTIQNDILNEFILGREYIYPLAPSMRLVTDVLKFCAVDVPRWTSVCVSGYDIREAGSTAAEELAFTLRDGIEYVQAGVEAGLEVDDFAPRMSFSFSAHSDFFEEIAKYRAARRVWAETMRLRFGARNDRSWQLRFHARTAGASLTAQQPHNNVIRTALQALSAVLGGSDSVQTNALDEAVALPGASAATLALRTQQILASESGVTQTVDPFGGSYFVETLTGGIEGDVRAAIDQIDRLGGMVKAIANGFPQRQIADSAARFQQAVERREKIVVGVNDLVQATDVRVDALRVDDRVSDRQRQKLESLRQRRDHDAVQRTLDALRQAAAGTACLMPPILNAVRADATLGEMCDALRDVWGEEGMTP